MNTYNYGVTFTIKGHSVELYSRVSAINRRVAICKIHDKIKREYDAKSVDIIFLERE